MSHNQLRAVPCLFIVGCWFLLTPAPLWAQGGKVKAVELEGAELQAESQPEGQSDPVLQRQQWLRSGRTALGENPADLLHRAYEQKMKMRRLAAEARTRAAAVQNAQQPNTSAGVAPAISGPSPNSGTAFLNWVNLGPAPIVSDPTGFQDYGPITGRVTAIAVDQNDVTGNTVYVGAAFGGVWKSTNAASANPTWTPTFDSQPTLSIGAIAISASGTILVGTGEPNSAGDSYYGMGIFRSTDGGATWTAIPSADGGTRSFRGLGFSAIAFNNAGNIAVASAAATIGSSEGGESQGPSGRGLYYSIDGGVTWSYATVQDNGVTVQPGSSNAVVYNPVTSTFYAHIRFHGYYSSTDGANWSRMASQPGTALSTTACPPVTSQATCPIYRADLTVRNDTGDLYTIYVDSNSSTATGGEIYKWAGGVWSKLGQAAIDTCGDSSGCGTEQATFNLYLRAVPNGSNTDLYMGAVNIFKCSASAANPLCTASGSWLNLTHAYGCSPNLASSAHVHPDQHAIAYAQGNPLIVYFGNDGGLYRTLNASLLSSSCTPGSNAFGNLNSGLGSLSEFVSFAQHPTDASVVLGGLQDNGSPLSNLSIGNGWTDVNGGDGGFNAIDPNSPSTYYTANFNVSIQRCLSGSACNANSLSSNSFSLVVQQSTVGKDTSAFYMPYLLDPALTSRLVLGTCRVWRGNGDGTGFAALSNNFSTGDATVCAGDSISGQTKIRSLAVGGVNNGNGSEVIYAGMLGVPPVAGHVFVTTDADDTSPNWTDVTGNINPSAYDISDIVISPYDPTGQTAYLTIMGFGSSHIFKTTNAGTAWTDLTSNLPDAPANSVAIDPVDPSTIYIGTDVGVFISADDGVTWSELGTGMPSVPAIKLRTFSSGNIHKLRAATYGRGLWEVDLSTSQIPVLSLSSTQLNFSPQPINTTSTAQSVTVTNIGSAALTISSILLNGAEYSAMNTCPSSLAPRSNCAISATFTPSAGGSHTGTITITDNAQGSPHSILLSGSVPTPNLSVTPGSLTFADTLVGTTVRQSGFQLRSTGNVPLTISSIATTGDYSQTNNCAASIPLAASACTFAISFKPTQAGTRSGSLVITDNAAGSPHIFPISGTGIAQLPQLTLSTGSLSFAHQTLGTTSPSQVLTVSNNTSSTITIAGITLAGAFSQTNNCGVSLGAGSTCAVSVAFTPTAGGAAAGTLTLQDGSGDHAVVQLSGTGADFIFGASSFPTSAGVGAGQTATYAANVVSEGGFAGPVSLSCSGGPTGSTCAVSPATLNLASGASSIISISVVVPPRASLRHSPKENAYLPAASLFSIWGIVLLTPKARRHLLTIMLACLFMVTLGSCGSGKSAAPATTSTTPAVSPNPLAGNYTITVSGTSGGLVRTTTLSLQVN